MFTESMNKSDHRGLEQLYFKNSPPFPNVLGVKRNSPETVSTVQSLLENQGLSNQRHMALNYNISKVSITVEHPDSNSRYKKTPYLQSSSEILFSLSTAAKNQTVSQISDFFMRLTLRVLFHLWVYFFLVNHLSQYCHSFPLSSLLLMFVIFYQWN